MVSIAGSTIALFQGGFLAVGGFLLFWTLVGALMLSVSASSIFGVGFFGLEYYRYQQAAKEVKVTN